MTSFIKLLYTLLLAHVCGVALGQSFPVFKFTPKEGLSNSIVYRITQDKRGFIWFSTNNGISRYDGSEFKNFGIKEGLTYSAVLSISESENQEKWIANYHGKLCVLKQGKIKPLYGKETFIEPLLFTQFDNNRVWCISQRGILHVITLTKSDTSIENITETKYPEEAFRSFLKKDNHFFIASDHGVYTIREGNIQHYLPNIINEKVFALEYAIKNNTLIVALKDKIIFVKEGKVVKTLTFTLEGGISDILLDKQGRLWLTGLGKIYLYDGRSIKNLSRQFQLNDILINDLFEDKNGNIWLATYGQGAYCISNINLINYTEFNGKPINNINSLVAGEESIFASSIGEVFSINNSIVSEVHFSDLLAQDYTYFIKILNDTLYVGTHKRVLYKSLKNNRDGIYITGEGVSFNNRGNTAFLFGKFRGYREVKRQRDGKFSTNELNLIRNRVNAIEIDSFGWEYFGTDSGLFIKKGNNIKHLQIGSSQLSNNINHILIDNENAIWLATNSGVFKLNKLGSKQENFPLLRNIKCTSLQEDQLGNIWVGTFNGIYKIRNRKVFNYTTSSGLVSNEVLSLAIDKYNRLWIGTVNGISCVNSVEKLGNEPINAIYITQAATSDTVFNYPSSISLSYYNSDINISFIGINFPVANNIEYQYTIENLSKGWRITSLTSIELPSLASGKYTFKVKARKNNGKWSKPVSLTIFVPPPFWQELWFIVFVGLLLLTILLLIIRAYAKSLEKKHIKRTFLDSQMVVLKQKALRAMINPHFIFNCVNNILGHIQKNEREIAKSYLIQFSSFFRMTLEHSKHEYINLSEEIKRLEVYLKMEQLRFGERLKFIISNSVVSDTKILIPNMIIQPFIENAIIHGVMPKESAGIVSVIFEVDKEVLIVTIEDDGKGFDIVPNFNNIKQAHTSTKTSLGIQLSIERLDLLTILTSKNHSIQFGTSINYDGAMVKISIPIISKKAHIFQFANE